jgi:hypothetical protein
MQSEKHTDPNQLPDSKPSHRHHFAKATKAAQKRATGSTPVPVVQPHEWERRKARIQRRHPHITPEFYLDPKTNLWTMKTICAKTGQIKIVAANKHPYKALHFGMEALVDRAIIK